MTTDRPTTEDWLNRHWVTGAGFMAAAFLSLTPALARMMPLPVLLIFLHTPAS